MSSTLRLDDRLDAPDLAAHQSHFDAMRMGRGFGEDILDNPLGQFPGGLILLQDDQDGHAGFDVGTCVSIHYF